MFTILHLSDLHRSPDAPVDNATLLAALTQDFKQHKKESPAIAPIDAIIVTGDIINGSTLGRANYADDIILQYSVAEEFLIELASRFLNSDRTKIILTPGNHDVDINTSFSAMTAHDESEAQIDSQNSQSSCWLNRIFGGVSSRESTQQSQEQCFSLFDRSSSNKINLLKELKNPESLFRYDFKNRIVYKITNQIVYKNRMNAYASFAAKFYNGCNFKYPYIPDRAWNVFELCNDAIVVTTFSSCDKIDCFRDVGSIAEGDIGKSYLAINDSRKPYLLAIALWHHSSYAIPFKTDFMDRAQVLEIAKSGYQIGLHGHLHKAMVVPETVKIPSEETIVVVSAGSLCAGPRGLPPGQLRQYNIIEINDDFNEIRVHVRQMNEGNAFGPNHLPEFGGKSYIDIKLSEAKSSVGTTEDKLSIYYAYKTTEAESLLMQNCPSEAVGILLPIFDKLSDHGRLIFTQAAEKSSNLQAIDHCILVPRNINELIVTVDAKLQLSKHDDAAHFLDKFNTELHLDSASYEDLKNRISIAKEMSK